MKKIFAMIVACTMLFSLPGAILIEAEAAATYDFYTHAGDSFIPDTDAVTSGVTWTNGTAAVDTSVMGRKTITGTDESGSTVTGYVNVGIKKYAAYVNAENKTAGEEVLLSNTAEKGVWRYGSSSQTAGCSIATYASKERVAGEANMALSYIPFKGTAASDDRNTEIRSTAPEGISSDFEITFRTRVDGYTSGQECQTQLDISDSNSVKVTIVIKRASGGSFSAKINGAAITEVKNDSQWIWLKVTYTNSTNTFSLYDLNDNGAFIHSLAPASDFATLSYTAFKSAMKTGAADTRMYLDDYTVTDSSTTDYIYYGVPSDINLTAKVGEDISDLYTDVPFVLENGTAIGFCERVKVSHTLSTEKTGSYSQSVAAGSTGQNVKINLSVAADYTLSGLLIKEATGYGAFGLDEGISLASIDITKISDAEGGTLTAALYDKNGSKISDIASVEISASDFTLDTKKTVSFPANSLSFGENNPDECKVVVRVKNSAGEGVSNTYEYQNDIIDGSETIYIAGDSTGASYPYYQRPKSGWGEMLGYYMGKGVTVDNRAVGGRSSKSFIEEERLSNLITDSKEGDYLFVQFGHNDRAQTGDDEAYAAKRTTPAEYKEYLKQYITQARSKGVNPVLVTPIVEATYINGALAEDKTKYVNQLGEYAQAMRETAKETATPLVDAYAKTKEFFNNVGEEESRNYYLFCDANGYWTNDQKDTTHLQESGAHTVAGLIAAELQKNTVFEDAVRVPIRTYDIAENYVTEDFQGYSQEDVGKQVWAQPFALAAVNLDTDNFTVEYENAASDNKVGKMRGYDEELGDTSNERAAAFFNKLASGLGEIGLRMKLDSTASNRIELNIYGSDSILIWVRFQSDSSGRYSVITYYPAKSTGTGSDSRANKTVVSTAYTSQAGNEVQSIAADEWTDVKFVMHEDTRSYDLYINGLQAAVNVPYFNYGAQEEPLASDNVYYRAEKMYITVPTKAASVIYVDDLYAKDYMYYGEPIAMEMDMYKGEMASLPEKALVRMDDGHTVKELPVKWASSPDSSAAGTATVTGTIESIGKDTSITVNVKELPFEAESFVLTDENGQVYSTKASETKIGVNVKKYTNTSVDGDVYICVYDSSGRLTGTKKISMPASDWENVSRKLYETELTAEEGSSVRAFILNASITPLAFGKVFDDAVKDEVKIFLAGDSTVCPYKDSQRPQAGWGEYIGNYFTDNVTIVNKAVGSRSTKSFYNEGRLDAIFEEASEGDYLFIQLGHNDTGAPPASHTEADTTYKEYLTLYVNEARSHGMYPVLITPVERFGFVNDVMKTRHGDYPQAMIEAAQELNVPLIDLRAKSNAYYSAMGEEAAKAHYMVSVEPYEDYTHLTRTGAEAMAELVAEGVAESVLPVAEYLKSE